MENLKKNVENEKILDQLRPLFLEPCIINFIFEHRYEQLRYIILDLLDTNSDFEPHDIDIFETRRSAHIFFWAAVGVQYLLHWYVERAVNRQPGYHSEDS